MKSFLLGLVLAVSACDSHAIGRLATVEVLNRDTGQTLPVYRSRGEYWVAGSPGTRYSVVIHNALGGRVLAVMAIDGVNVISGETGAYDQTGYVLCAGQTAAIDGWRKSNQEIAAFNFTALPDSYAARTGRAANVGVIGVALFQEKPAPSVQYAVPSAPPDAAALPRDKTESPSADSLSRRVPERRAGSMLADPDVSRLGTGHWARETSYVSHTDFERLTTSPGETIRIRYDRYENLVAMGVVRARPIPPAPNPFPDAGPDRYVPDPPGL